MRHEEEVIAACDVADTALGMVAHLVDALKAAKPHLPMEAWSYVDGVVAAAEKQSAMTTQTLLLIRGREKETVAA